MAPFRSLRVRLPLQMTTLIAVVLAAFLWTANRAITATVGRAGAERALVVATQLSNLLAQNATRGLTEMQRIAADDEIRRYVRSPAGDRAAVVERRLRPFAAAGQPPVLLLSDSGAPILEIAPASPATGAAASLPLPSGVPATLGVGPFKHSGNTVFSEVVVEVQDPSPRSDDDVEPPHSRAGFLVIRRVLTVAQNADLVNRLVGTGASVAIGNRSGDFWTDFSGKEMKVPVDASQSRTASYQAGDRDTRIGGLSVIDGTPWAVWVEFPEGLLLAPARTVVSRLALIALGVVLIAAVLVTMISARITRPLIDLTHASEAIAAGQYSTPVETNRQDEIGRLGVAFTAMTEQVARGKRTLEERVQERTASLEDTRALLEQQVEELQKARADLDHFFALSPDMLCIADMN